MKGWALSPQVAAFAQRLRAEGLPIGSGDTRDALLALSRIPLTTPKYFRLALRQTLAKSAEEQQVFDRVFADFWLAVEPQIGAVAENADEDETDTGEQTKMPGAPAAADVPVSGATRPVPDDGRSSGASTQPRLMQRDFADLSGAEIDEMQDLIALIGKRLASRAGRRWRVATRGPVDLRRSLRAALARGGEMLEIKHKQRRPQRLNLVVLADVSHSMDTYSRFFLQFIFAFQNLFRRMDTFVFSTRLSRVTDALRRGRLSTALDALAEDIVDWSGGTRIGESLHTFLHQYGDQLLNQHSVVMIVSDGWDSGDSAALDSALRAIRLRCRQIIWLDPLRDHPRFFASAAGAHTDSRWIDHCLPARDVHSLQRATDRLEAL